MDRTVTRRLALGGAAALGLAACGLVDTSANAPQPGIVTADQMVTFRSGTEILPAYYVNQGLIDRERGWTKLGNYRDNTRVKNLRQYAYRIGPGNKIFGPFYVEFQFGSDQFSVAARDSAASFKPDEPNYPDPNQLLGKKEGFRWMLGTLTLFEQSDKDGLRSRKFYLGDHQDGPSFTSGNLKFEIRNAWEEKSGTLIRVNNGERLSRQLLENYGEGPAAYLYEQYMAEPPTRGASLA